MWLKLAAVRKLHRMNLIAALSEIRAVWPGAGQWLRLEKEPLSERR